MKKTLALLLCLALLFGPGAAPALAADADADTELPEPERREVDFLPYAEALWYFDFNKAAYNWCLNFGWDPDTDLNRARDAILAGTDPRLIVGLATFARDTGHGDELLAVTNAFRPACYQEVIGLHDANANTGPFRRAMLWNGRSVTDFWWSAESAPGWPEAYALDLRPYDLQTLDLRYFYRAALRLWDNTWANGYYARPGCSAHNSGMAMDLGNYWIAANFETVYTVNGEAYDMADYGLYKPLQPGNGSAGETWHITCSPSVTALGNYDQALDAGYEIVYALYYNPSSRGWSMADGRGVYLGAGVTLIQLRLCQLGLLGSEYITGYYDSVTEAAVMRFQEQNGLGADGICGGGTTALLFAQTPPPADDTPPDLTDAVVTAVDRSGFKLRLRGEDEQRLSAFRVDTKKEDAQVWVTRYYNAPVSGLGTMDVDIWEEGSYQIRAAARDAGGNESELRELGSVFVDATAPVLECLRIHDITENGFLLTLRGSDNGALGGFTVTLRSDSGEVRENFLLSNGRGDYPWAAEGLEEGLWTVTVTATDLCGNSSSHTFRWQYSAGQALPGVSVSWFGPKN